MKKTKFQKDVVKEEISDRDVVFAYEYVKGEKPEVIDIKSMLVAGGRTAQYIGKYHFQTDVLDHQSFKTKRGETSDFITGIETVVNKIVESFNV